MIAWSCQCGRRTILESGMPPQDCQGCDECGTTYGNEWAQWKPLIPHEFDPALTTSAYGCTQLTCARCGEERLIRADRS